MPPHATSSNNTARNIRVIGTSSTRKKTSLRIPRINMLCYSNNAHDINPSDSSGYGIKKTLLCIKSQVEQLLIISKSPNSIIYLKMILHILDMIFMALKPDTLKWEFTTERNTRGSFISSMKNNILTLKQLVQRTP